MIKIKIDMFFCYDIYYIYKTQKTKKMPTYLDRLPEDLIQIIISHLYPFRLKRFCRWECGLHVPVVLKFCPPISLNIYDVLYFQYINKMKTKELVVICKDNKIKQSRERVTNQYVKRLNIIEKYLGRILNKEEKECVVFTRGGPSWL